ncbi:MAG: LemA family protein [Ignavibacteriales bacterium]
MWYVIIAIIVIFIIGILCYNSFIYKKNQVNNSFSSIDIFLKKRYDLIPNLVSVVKGYMDYEKTVLKDITELRVKGMADTISKNEKIDIDKAVTNDIKSLWGTVENYPDLKANQQFLKLQAALNDIEDQISAARRSYNASVNDYNNAIQMFPSNIMAGLLGLKQEKYFELEPAGQNKVSQDGN